MRLSALIFLVCLTFIPGNIHADETKKEEKKIISFEYELDAYYSNVGIYASLTDKPIPYAGEKSEYLIYKDLLYSSYIPRFLVLEASVNPLPCLGLFVKNNYPDFYEDFSWTDDFNLIEAVTAGFEEPYAFSLFLGNVISFSKPGEVTASANKGYMGYLFSTGNYHIKNNDSIRDNWYELEWKVKGDKNTENQSLHWSFRIGGKYHDNNEISDVFYISLRRSRIDYNTTAWTIFNATLENVLENSGFELSFDFDKSSFNLVQHTFYVSKKWPQEKYALTLDLGYIWESNKKYKGSLRDKSGSSEVTVLLRPNIEF